GKTAPEDTGWRHGDATERRPIVGLMQWAYPIGRFFSRPFRVRTGRELGYMLSGAVTATIAFGVVLAGTIAGVLLALLIVGLPVLIGIAYASRLGAGGE